MHRLKASCLLFILAVLLQGCASVSHQYKGTGIKHRSVKSCLEWIEINSGSEISTYRENTPLKVYGTLKNGQHFGCYFKLTGTDGAYYQDEWTELSGKPPSPLDGSTKYIVVKGGYCNVSDDCVHGLYCSENKCVNGRVP